MRITGGMRNLVVAVLGVVSTVLVINVVTQYRALQPGYSRAQNAPAIPPPARAGKRSSQALEDLARYDPSVNFAGLKKLDSRPLPDEERNPFEYVGGAAPRPPTANEQKPEVPAPPPAPPPPPLKAVGFNELPGGKKEAMVTFNDDLVVVHEGDMVGTQFKVVKIDPSKVVVEDGTNHQTLDLPFPQ